MAKTLDRPRPTSTIADMIDGGLIEQATTAAPPPPPPESSSSAETHPKSIQSTVPPVHAAHGTGEGIQRTGEHSDIQKMYRLTPTAHRAVQQLSAALSTSLGFDVNNSVVIRSVLRVIHDASADINRAIEQGLSPRKQPSTAIGNEHARDALEAEIAEAIVQGILGYATTRASK